MGIMRSMSSPSLRTRWIVVEEGETGCVIGPTNVLVEECEELLHHAHPHWQDSMMLDTHHDKEALGDAGQSQLDDEGKQTQHEDTSTRTFAELNAAANRIARLQILYRACQAADE